MNVLKKKLMKKADSKKTGIIVLAIGLLIGAGSIVQTRNSLKEFDSLTGEGSTVEVVCLEGPCCGYYDGNKLKLGIYIGADTDDNPIIVATDKESGINLYGVDFNTDSEYAQLEYIKMVGKTEKVDDDIAEYIADCCSISKSEVYSYFGYYYLDTTQSPILSNLGVYIMTLLVVAVGVIILVDCIKKEKNLEAEFDRKINEEGFKEIASTFEGKTLSYQNILISDKYLIEIHEGGSFKVYNLTDYNNVYKCNIVDKAYSSNTYIALENSQGRVLVAPTVKENKKFYSVIQYLKDHVSSKEEQQ